MKKNIVKIALIGCASLMLSSCGNSSKEVLNVYNWGEYIDPSVVEDFEKETGIKVVYDLFETNEEMYPIIEAGAVNYDVVCPSDYMAQKMIENGLLEEIDISKLENANNIGEKYWKFAQTFDQDNKYLIPYNWGTVGIIYNSDEVKTTPDSWSILWDEQYAGEILMQDSVRDAFMVGEKMLGYSLNTTDVNELNEVKEKLIEQKPLVQAYVIDQVRDKMIGGEADLAVIYSGELMYIKNEIEKAGSNLNLKYVIPKEGTNIWLDGWVIPKNAKNKENAMKWLDYMLRADVAKKNFEYITYPTPNVEALKLIDEDIRNDKSVFPDDDMLTNSEVFKYLGVEMDALYSELWKEVKAK